MELVYLWVEGYKNIKNQGFNFSPRFECEYKDGDLTITPKDHIENFFWDNINITAIVGENGSGKSRILKFLYSQNGFTIFKNKENDTFYFGDPNNYQCLKKYKKLVDNDKKKIFSLFDYSFTYDDELSYGDFTFPKKQIRDLKGAINFKNELIKNQKNILLNYFTLKNNNQLEKFDKFFQPKTINIYIDIATVKTDYQLESTRQIYLNKLKGKITDGSSPKCFSKILKKIEQLLNNQISYEQKQFEDFKNIFISDPFSLGNHDDQAKELHNIWHKDYNQIINLEELSELKTIKKIKEDDLLDSSTIYLIYSFDIEKLNPDAIEVIMASFSSNHFTIELCDVNDKKLNDLSFGEQQLLFVLNQLYSLKDESIEDEENFNKVQFDNFIVLLDEIDIGFHPDWQKRMISYICDFLKLLPNINFHLIFATHSPFLLSDIPKENIIFLEKDKTTGYCKNVTKETSIETFGANIHTLLSHGFFMKDGLMGEFAKGKINEAIKYLNQKTLTEKEIDFCEHIISIIGEPILKRQLQRMLDSKRLSKIDKLDKLEEELEFIKHRINLLSKRL